MFRPLLVLVGLLILSGCSQPRIEDHAGFAPNFQVSEFFSGQLSAHGVVRDRSGTVIRTFTADIAASQDGATVILDEDFEFDNGDLDKRVWRLQPNGDATWQATAGDVVGEGLLTTSGNALFLDYTLRIPWRDGTIDVRVDDRMYQVAPDLLVNESVMKKFGVKVGSILLVIQRHAEPS